MSNNGDTTLESGTPSPPPTRECPDSLHILDALPYLSFGESIISVDGVEMNNLPQDVDIARPQALGVI